MEFAKNYSVQLFEEIIKPFLKLHQYVCEYFLILI